MYVCVFCGTPCTALYRRLTINTSSSSSSCSGDSSDAASSQVSSIKAMSCVNCHRPVDPYTERECLLVTIDCILLRPEAYRHVLYNTQDLSWSKQKDGVNSSNTNDRKKRASSSNNDDDDDDDDQEDESDDCDIQNTSTLLYRLARWSIVSTLLHAYLKWETFVQGKQQLEGEIRQEKEEADASFALLYMIFSITSALDLFVQWIAVYGYTRLVARMTTFSSSPTYHRNNAAYQIFLGLLLPTSFQVVCVSVLIWENSNTTRALGSLLIACWQCLALSLITINNPSNSHGDGNNNSNNNNNNNNNNNMSCACSMRMVPLGWQHGQWYGWDCSRPSCFLHWLAAHLPQPPGATGCTCASTHASPVGRQTRLGSWLLVSPRWQQLREAKRVAGQVGKRFHIPE